ncbi:HutD family protein [Trinickia sp. YCB016]
MAAGAGEGTRQPHEAHEGRAGAVTLLRAADLVASRWKNGGGVTREIAAYPWGSDLDTFVWRVSVADVEKPGAFSRFPGIDRSLVLLSGNGMLLDERGGITYSLMKPLDAAHFNGETAIDASLVDGPTRDFNLMLRRGRVRGLIDVWRGNAEHTLDADVMLLFCASGTFDVTLGGEASDAGAPVTLGETDTLCIEAPRALSCAVSGSGVMLAVYIRYV